MPFFKHVGSTNILSKWASKLSILTCAIPAISALSSAITICENFRSSACNSNSSLQAVKKFLSYPHTAFDRRHGSLNACNLSVRARRIFITGVNSNAAMRSAYSLISIRPTRLSEPMAKARSPCSVAARSRTTPNPDRGQD